ncbi:MAG: hypothetical protein GY828_00435 [Candidatus Gracilibacteria bacterium]|nr:hypothetical protein [Candidatus Gracilibacteria bacterium]
MLIVFGIIISLLIFTIIVVLHELGHFWAARIFGVRVEEFGIGIPPRAKKLFYDKKGTLYSLNWLPLGGFVKLTGESPNTFYVFDKNKNLYNNDQLEKDILDEVAIFTKEGKEIGETHKQAILKALQDNAADFNLSKKPAWQQAIIMLAGVFMNFLLAGIIFSILFFTGIKPVGVNTKIETQLPVKLVPNYQQALESGVLLQKPGVILSPISGGIAEKAGIQKNDILLEITSNNTSVLINDYRQVSDIISKNSDQQLTLKIKRNFQDFTITVTPKSKDDNIGKIGSYLGDNIQINPDFEYKYGFIDSIKYGFYETYNQSLLTFQGISGLMRKIFSPKTPTERQEAVQQISGPIGIVDFITNSMSNGFVFMMIIAAVISINLGVFNLLPIPALDGGRFLFITVNGVLEKLFGKKIISANIENVIHLGFFLLLIALSVLIGYNDIIKLLN